MLLTSVAKHSILDDAGVIDTTLLTVFGSEIFYSKHLQTNSEHCFLQKKFSFQKLINLHQKRIQNPIKHLRWKNLQNKLTVFSH